MKIKKPVPFAFVLDLLEPLAPYTKPMFGCTAVYIEDRIVLILRDRATHTEDNGVWLATTPEHHESLQRDFPYMRRIALLAEGGPTGWQNLPLDSPDFEEAVDRACRLVLRGDPRIGKVPDRRGKRPAGSRKKAAAKRKAARRTTRR